MFKFLIIFFFTGRLRKHSEAGLEKMKFYPVAYHLLVIGAYLRSY